MPIQKREFIIENPLREKQLKQIQHIQELLEEIKSNLENNFSEYTKEFEGEPMGFTYYLGSQLLFSNSVEIVQKVYHKERKDIGDLYYSLVVKFNSGQYYYWKW